MKKRILIILLGILMVIAGAVYYFNAFILPQKLRTLVNEKGQELLQRNISYDTIQFDLQRGISMTGLHIAQKEDPEKTFFSAKEISSKVPVLPLLREKKILLPSIVIKGFTGNIEKLNESSWNFSDLFEAKAPSTERSFKIFLGKIILQQGSIHASDYMDTFKPLTLSIDNLTAALSLPKKVRFTVAAKIKEAQASIKAQGDYSLIDRSLNLNTQISDLDLMRYVMPFLKKKPQFDRAMIQNADLRIVYSPTNTECHGDIAADIKTALKETEISGSLTSQGSHVSIGEGHVFMDVDHFSMTDAQIKYKNDIEFNGEISTEKFSLTEEAEKSSVKGNIALKPSSLVLDKFNLSAENITLDEFLFEIIKPEDEIFERTGFSTNLNATALVAKIDDTVISGNLSAPRFDVLINEEQISAEIPLTFSNANISRGDIFTFNGDIKIPFMELRRTEETFSLSGIAESHLLSFDLSGDRSGEVVPNAKFRIIKDLTKLKDLTYSVDAKIKDGKISNALPDFQQISDIHGGLSVVNDTITLQDILLDTRGTTMSINGELRTFSKLISDLKIKAKDLLIREWLPLVQQYLEPYGLTIDGKTDVELRITGPLIGLEKPTFTLETQLRGADIQSSKYPYVLNDAAGQLRYKEDELAWSDLNFVFNDQRFSTSGDLENFKTPIITAKLQGPDFFVSANIEADQNEYTISRANLKTKYSNLDGGGLIRIDQGQPYGDFKVKGDITLSDLRKIHPLVKEKIQKFNILGEGKLDLTYDGPLKDPFNAALSLAYQSPYTSIKNIRLENLFLKITQPTPQEGLYEIAADFYKGVLTAKGNLTARNDWPFSLQARIFDVNLKKFLYDLPIKKRDYDGTLAVNVFMEGPAKNTKEITGQGHAQVRKARIVKPNFLKGILGIILNPEYSDIVFTDAKAKVFIRDNKLKLMDIFLKSRALDLTGHGWIDLKKNMDFTISPSFKDSLSIKSTLLKSSAENLLEKYISIRVTGKPGALKYSTNLESANIIEDAADIFSEGVGEIIRGLGL